MSNSQSEAQVVKVLGFLQRHKRLRLALAALVLIALLGLALRSALQLVPKHYTLSITGGDIVSDRHLLARILQGEAAKHNLTLIVEPTATSLEALEKVSAGKLDLALVQGGNEISFPGIEHVGTLAPELVHFLVKPGISGIEALRARSINLGAKGSAERKVALTLTRFAGYQENVDFVETNYSPEQLLALPARKLPDAIIAISTVPSYLVELLVHRDHYQLMEIPFPNSLALRHGWAGSGTILAYTYDLRPPVPANDIRTVAVNMHLVGSTHADPDAIARLLEVLYSPYVANRLKQPLDEKLLAAPSRYPLSDGTTRYLHRNESIFTIEMWKKLQSLIGVIASFSGIALVAFRASKGKMAEPIYTDQEFLELFNQALKLEKEALAMDHDEPIEAERVRDLRLRLGQLHVTLLERYPGAILRDPALIDRCLSAVDGARSHLNMLGARVS